MMVSYLAKILEMRIHFKEKKVFLNFIIIPTENLKFKQ